jgi:hypothetical protein
VAEAAAHLSAGVSDAAPTETVGVDELYTFVVNAVARGSRPIVGEGVTWVFDVAGRQAMADTLPEVYPAIIQPDAAWHHVSIAKEETCTIAVIDAGCPLGSMRT